MTTRASPDSQTKLVRSDSWRREISARVRRRAVRSIVPSIERAVGRLFVSTRSSWRAHS